MIRTPTANGWRLIRHQDHARLAGDIAGHWGNEQFVRPGPDREVLLAVAHHDDAWAERDTMALRAPDGRPAAFSSELVGVYSAFENIDLAEYLAVRGAATETIAAKEPLSAVLISMHTVNLLTEQADLSTLNAEQKDLHARFIAGQRSRQQELLGSLPAAKRPSDEQLQTAFEFLQACDSCSLTACVQYTKPIPLRHTHLTRSGERVAINCTQSAPNRYRLSPYPLATPELVLHLPSRCIHGVAFDSVEELQAAYLRGNDESVTITLHH
jgi:hypothetical protein